LNYIQKSAVCQYVVVTGSGVLESVEIEISL